MALHASYPQRAVPLSRQPLLPLALCLPQTCWSNLGTTGPAEGSQLENEILVPRCTKSHVPGHPRARTRPLRMVPSATRQSLRSLPDPGRIGTGNHAMLAAWMTDWPPTLGQKGRGGKSDRLWWSAKPTAASVLSFSLPGGNQGSTLKA